MRSRSLLLFTAFSAASLALLIGLGLWQLQRLEWKQGLIAQIEARAHAKPVTLKEAVTRARTGEDVSYLRVRVEGRFDNAKERYLYALSDGTPGWHVIAPLTTPDGEVVLVDRGFVPDAFKEPSSRAQGEINDAVTVTGLARTSETQGLFIPDNEPAENRWFWRDLGVGTSSSEASRVGIVKFLLYLPVIVTSNRPVLSSRESSTASSLPARLRSFSSSLMLRQIFVGSVETNSWKIGFWPFKINHSNA